MRIYPHIGTLVGLALATLVGATTVAGAQDAENVGVMDRQRPAYDSKGIPLGGFRLFPRLDVVTSYDDNVFNLAAKQSDFVISEVGTARLQSQWGRHFLEAYAGLNNYNYTQYSSLDLTDWNVGGDGRYDVERGSAIGAGGNYGEHHEPLYSPNTAGNQASPTRFYKGHAEATGTYQINRLGFGTGFSFDQYNYQAAPLNGGGFINNADRNENEYQGYLRAQYDFSPGYATFVKVSYDNRAYEQFFDRAGYHRSSTGYRYNAGVDLQISNLLRGEIYGGYLEQHFSQNLAKPLKNVSGLDFGGSLDWFADPLLTVHLTGSHQISDITVAGVSASDDESVRLSADYEVSYNIIARAFVAYTHSHLQGITRQDDYPSAGADVRYYLNNYLSLDLDYRYSARSSNVAGTNFNDNVISIGITGHI